MLLPGLNSVIVPEASVVVVVVVVSDTWAHANGAATASAMLNITFFIFGFLRCSPGPTERIAGSLAAGAVHKTTGSNISIYEDAGFIR
jgi:hypothetical protein